MDEWKRQRLTCLRWPWRSRCSGLSGECGYWLRSLLHIVFPRFQCCVLVHKNSSYTHIYTEYSSYSCTPCLNPPPCHLSPVQSTQIRPHNFIRPLLHLTLRSCKYNLNMCRVALVWVNPTVRTVCAATCFLIPVSQSTNLTFNNNKCTYGGLLHHDVFDVEIFNVNVLRISIRFRILQ